MSQENVDVVEKFIATFATDADAFRECLHPDIEWFPFEENHVPSFGVGGGMRVRNQWLDPWAVMQADVEEVVDKGNSVVVSLHVTGRGKSSGVEVDVRLYMHFRVRDGKIVYLFEHTDRAAALEAMGLSEQDAHADS
jgi:ketosteroid isomerase-like protein